jgi:alkylation response protein AidB-like acyl-CoA dehydrogenase
MSGVTAEEVHQWVDEHWSLDITVGVWWERLAEAGYAYPSWPGGLGGLGASGPECRTIQSVLAARGVIGPPSGHVGAGLTAPTLLAHGDEAQKQRYVRAIADGREAWCQLFSEPGSGSDLASLGTRAVRDGCEWVVTGQKVWNSAADSADFGMLMARTDIDRPKNQGISYFLIDMHQPGIEVRPLKQMNGDSSFCEVFLTEARVRADAMVGGVAEGWQVAQTTLGAERNAVANRGGRGLVAAISGSAGDLDRLTGEVFEEVARAGGRRPRPKVLKSNAVPWRTMADWARRSGAASDPVTRQELARYHAQIRVNSWLMQRIARSGGRLTGADGSLAKLATSRICQQSRELGYRIAGSSGLLLGPDSPLDGTFQPMALGSPGARLGGGTDEIQLNIVGERGLALPREPAPDREVPYRDLQVGTQRSP